MQTQFIRRPIAFAISGVLGTAIALVSQGVLAQDKVERVTVTGSSIKQIETETALPVQIITREDIERVGATNTEDLLKTITATSGAGGTQTSSNMAGATSSGRSSVALRGLGETRTLVLVNGRRVSTFGGAASGNQPGAVDVNSIPVSAIERIEVLKDGASAVYGSDAVAGVINFILKSSYKGAEVTAGYGSPTASGGATATKANILFGNGNGNPLDYFATFTYDKETQLMGASRSFASSAIDYARGNDSTSSNTFPANIVTGGGATRNFLAPAYAGAFGTAGCAPSTGADANFPANRCRFDPGPYVSLLPQQERLGANINMKMKLSGGREFYEQFSITQNTLKSTIQPTPISDIFSLSNSPYLTSGAQAAFLAGVPGLAAAYAGAGLTLLGNGTIVVQPGQKYYPTAFIAAGNVGGITVADPILVRYRAFENGLRSIKDVNQATRLVLGMKGFDYGWDWDAAFSSTTSQVKEYTTAGYALYSQIMPLLNSGLVNPFGASDPAVQGQIQATNYNGLVFQSNTKTTGFDLTGSRELGKLPAGMVNMAAGAVYRQETFTFTSSTQAQTGDLTGYGGNFLPVDKSRSVVSAFTEFNVPIVKKLDATVAARYDSYGGTGSTTNPKLSLRWVPDPRLLVRGSIGSGFRAPSLTDLYAPQVTGVTVAGTSDPLRCPITASNNDCGTQFPLLTGGNPRLSPEKSVSRTMGLVLEPTRDIHMGIDYFDIFVRNMIVLGGQPYVNVLQSAALTQQYASLFTRGPATPLTCAGCPGVITNVNQLNANLGNGHVNGFDVDLKWRLPATRFGRGTLALNGTYMNRYDVQGPDGLYASALANANVASTISANQVVARWKHIARGTWDFAPWSISLMQNYQSGYTDLDSNFTGVSRTVPAYVTWDTQGSYTGFRDVRITAGVRNLLNTAPPYSNVGGLLYFQSGYDPSYADPRMRFVYANVSWKFK